MESRTNLKIFQNHIEQLKKQCSGKSAPLEPGWLIRILLGENRIWEQVDDIVVEASSLIAALEQQCQTVPTVQQELDASRTYCLQLQRERDAAQQRAENLQLELEQANSKLAQAPKGLNPEATIQTIQRIISMRDDLLRRERDLCKAANEESQAIRIVRRQLRETARLLAEMDVEILDEKGTFDDTYQMVVDTIPAESPEQIDQIAEVFRPGYKFRGAYLRPQEVILFA